MTTSKTTAAPEPSEKLRERTIYKVTIVGTIVNIALAVLKFVAGILGRSSAMIADACHSLSDLISDLAVLIFVKIASKPVDNNHPYGHAKYETLASALIGLLLFVVGVGIAIDGISKIISVIKGETLASPGVIALVAAVVSIASKEWLFQYTVRNGKRIDSGALVANAWHHRSDAMTSIATLIGVGGAILLGNKFAILDPIAAVIVSGFVIKAAFDITKPAIEELTEASLSPAEVAEIEDIIRSTPDVKDYHRLRTRKIGSHRAIESHIKLSAAMTLERAQSIASELERRLRERFGSDTLISIHMEPFHRSEQA